MAKPFITSETLREVPAYSIAEAAHYLQMPTATLRSWVLGRDYPVTKGKRFFQPVIEIADHKRRKLSFINLVEAHVLNAIRRYHRIALPKVRIALQYLKREIQVERPLAHQQFETDGVDLFIRRYGQLMSITQPGQYAMAEIIRAYLKLIQRDPTGIPMRLYLFPRRTENLEQPAPIVIDPALSFGRPVLAKTGTQTAILVDRFNAGESVDELAKDYDSPRQAIEEAIRFELQAA
jgi:uncharacterized protein (DUF433 family)